MNTPQTPSTNGPGPVMVMDGQVINTETGEVVPEATLDEVREIVAGYEQMYGMTSAEFLRRRKDGTFTEDSFEVMSWSMFLDLLYEDNENGYSGLL